MLFSHESSCRAAFSEASRQYEQFPDMLVPTEVSGSYISLLGHRRGLFCRLSNLNHAIGQNVRGKMWEVQRSLATYFPVHPQVRRDDGTAAGHRLNQRVSEGFGVRWGHIYIACPV